MTTRWLLSAALLLLSVPAGAQSWNRENANAGTVTSSVAPKSGQQLAYYYLATDATTDSAPLAVAACASISVETVTQPAATSELELYIRAVNTVTATCSSGRKILADLNGGGVDDLPMRGDHGDDEDVNGVSLSDVFWGFGPVLAGYICVDVTAPPGTGGDEGADTGYVVVSCAGY